MSQPAPLYRSKSAGLRVISFALPATLFLAACSTKPVRIETVEVKVPVAQPCAGERPTPPVPLTKQYRWEAMDVRQKAAATGKQALDWMTYGEQLNAATAACP